MKHLKSNIIILAIFIIFAFWIMAMKNGFMLQWYDEMSIFEYGHNSLRQYLNYPGGIFRCAGTFLTQLLYYPALGTIVLITIWLLCGWLTSISFRLTGASAALCFLIPLCMLASILQLDEAILTFESQGYVFYNTLGFAFSIAAYSLFTIARHSLYLQGIFTIILPLLYPFAGYFALLPAALCLLSMCIGSIRKRKILPGVFAVISFVLIWIVPFIYYRYFTGTTVDNEYLYLKGLPELTLNKYDWYLWYPFATATILLFLLFFISTFLDNNKIRYSKATRGISLSLFIIGILCCIKADGKKSEQLRASILMNQAIEQHDWNKATHIMSLIKESPNYTMCVLNNLARAYCGKDRTSVRNMMTETKDYRHDEEQTIQTFVNVTVNFNIGRFNQSHRWATEQNVRFGDRVFYIKYIVMNAIMNGDMAFAKKFNQQLMRTMFHKKWAENMNRYIENPDLVATIPDYDFLMMLRQEEIMRGE